MENESGKIVFLLCFTLELCTQVNKIFITFLIVVNGVFAIFS